MEFKELTDAYVAIKNKKKDIEADLSHINYELQQIEIKLMLAMEEMNLGKFSIPDGGTVYTTERFYAKTPKTPEDKEALSNYLKTTGEYEALISYNSQTLTAWYKVQHEAASAKGEVLEIPGITEVGVLKGLTLRKG